MKDRLVSYNSVDTDVRKLVLLGFRTSLGKVRENGVDYYLSDYLGDLSGWVLESVKYPSVLEHAIFTFYNRVLKVTSHQLVRCRLASYTQGSQKYSPTSEECIVPESIVRACFEGKYRELVNENFKIYDEMVKVEVPYEDVRDVLTINMVEEVGKVLPEIHKLLYEFRREGI